MINLKGKLTVGCGYLKKTNKNIHHHQQQPKKKKNQKTRIQSVSLNLETDLFYHKVIFCKSLTIF